MASGGLWEAVDCLAGTMPRNTAVVEGETRLTYRQILDEANRESRDIEAGSAPIVRALTNSHRDLIGLLAADMASRDVLIIDGKAPRLEVERTISTVEAWSDRVGGPRRPRSGKGWSSGVLLSTSGVSGKPKVVRRSWTGIIENAKAFATAASYSPADVVLSTTPISHCYGLGTAVVAPLCVGATVVLDPLPVAPVRLWELVGTWGATILQSVPFLYRWYGAQGGQTGALRMAISAGEPAHDETKQTWQARTGLFLSDHYGTTETGAVTLNRDGLGQGVGKPLPGVEVRMAMPSADGADGQVEIRTTGGAGDYIQDGVAHSLADPEGWILTDDLAVLDPDGSVILVGRRSARINVSGRKIDPIEVENALLSCKGVRECAVVGKPSSTTGEEIVACVVVTDEFSWPRARAEMKASLSSYKIPKRIEIRSELPRTASGKLRRGALTMPLGVTEEAS